MIHPSRLSRLSTPRTRPWCLALLVGLVCLLPMIGQAAAPAKPAGEVNLYSARQEDLIRPLLDRFTQATGIAVHLVTADADPLLQRLQAEGADTPADVFLTTDVGRLDRAVAVGVLGKVVDPALNALVPEAYRHPDGRWYGLSLRARVIAYARDRVKPAELSTYADLAAPRWKGKICVRSSQHVYNQSMVASFIAHQGVDITERWAKGLVANLGREPKGGDRDQIKAVAAGQCDLALINSYYIAGMIQSAEPAEREAVARVGLFWPDQQGYGVHVNLSGAGIVKGAKHPVEAHRLLSFLLSEEAQRWYAEHNNEFPVRPGVPVSEALKGFGPFKADMLKLSALATYSTEAARLMDRVGWK